MTIKYNAHISLQEQIPKLGFDIESFKQLYILVMEPLHLYIALTNGEKQSIACYIIPESISCS